MGKVVTEIELAQALLDCLYELDEIKELLFLLDSTNKLDDEFIETISSLSIPLPFRGKRLEYGRDFDEEIFFSDSPVVTKAKELLRSLNGVPEGCRVSCSKCQVEIEPYHPGAVQVYEDARGTMSGVFKEGCPYCGNTGLLVEN
jgi:hypothetical protein